MAKVEVKNLKNEKTKDLTLNAKVFGIEVNEVVLKKAIDLQLAATRQGTAKTKTVAEVSGGGRKPWRQKGTGRARQGSIRATQWRGGGIAGGVVPRDYTFKMNKKERSLALKSALTDKVNNKELVDKSGHVKIEVSLKNTDKHNIDGEELYTPFVVTLGAMLDKNQENVTISSGKVVNSGNKFVLVGIAAPGLYESTSIDEFKDMDKIVITFDTKKYKQPTIYTVSTPKLIENTDLEVLNRLDDVYRKVGLLKSNMDTIENGASELENGAMQLLNGTNEISKNLSAVKNYMEELTKGAYDLNQGVNQIITAIDASSSSLSTESLTESLSQLSTLKEKNNEAIRKLSVTNESLKAQYDASDLANKSVEEIMSLPLDEGTKKNLVTLKNTYEGNNNLIYLLSMNNQAIDTTCSTLTTTASKVKEQLLALRNGLVELESGSNTLYSSSKKITEGISSLYQGTNQLLEGENRLVSGTSTLKSGISTYNQEGISTLVGYANKIQNKTNKLKKLIQLSEDYKGFASDNTSSTTFVSVIK